MKLLSLLALPGAAYAAVQGFDISHYQPNVDYSGAYDSGARFVMIKVRFHPDYPMLTRAS